MILKDRYEIQYVDDISLAERGKHKFMIQKLPIEFVVGAREP